MSEFTIDIQLTELGFNRIPELNEELRLEETSQTNPSCRPADNQAPSKPPPVTNLPVDPRVLQLVQQNSRSLPKALPVVGTTVNTSCSRPPHTLEINQHLNTDVKKDSFSDQADSSTATTPAPAERQTAAKREKEDGKSVTNEITVCVDFRNMVEKSNEAEETADTPIRNEKRNTANGSNVNKESSAEKTAAPDKADTRNDSGAPVSTPNDGQGDTSYNESDDSEVSEQEEDEEEEEEEEDDEDDAHYLAADGLGERPCSVCQQKFNNAFLLREHMHVHTGVRPYRCAECSKQFCHLANYRAHLRTHASSVPIRCCVCQTTFQTEERLEYHLQLTHLESEFYQCDFCKRIFTRLEDCEIHTHNHEAEARLPQCPKCGRRFKTEKSLRRHLHKRFCQRNYVCNDCGQIFRKKNTLLRHSFTHLGMLPYTCTHCDTHFRLARSYRRHECKPEAIRCVACLSTFTSTKDFKEHKKATGCWGSLQRQQQQQTRKKRKAQNQAQHQPQQNPSEELQIRCMECGQTFSTAEELKKHASSHQRVLKCAECGMGFRSAIMLMSHMGGHAAQRPVLCQECGLGFPHPQLYDLHLKTCGQEPPEKTKKKTSSAPSNPVKTAKKKTKPAPTPSKGKEGKTANVAQTPPPPPPVQPEPAAPERPAGGGWRLSLDKPPPPNTSLIMVFPVSTGIPGLAISAPEPQNLTLKKQDGVAASVQPPQAQDCNANLAVNLEQNITVLDSVQMEAPRALQCEQQRLNTLPQLRLDPVGMKTDVDGTDAAQTSMSSGLGNTLDASNTVKVKGEEEESATGVGEHRFGDEIDRKGDLTTLNVVQVKKEESVAETVENGFDDQIEVKGYFTRSNVKTSEELKDVILPNVTKETGAFDRVEQSDVLKTDTGSESSALSNLLISDVRRSEVPLDLRLTLNSNECPKTSSQEVMVNDALAGRLSPGHDRALQGHEVGDNSSFTAVEVDLGGDDHREDEGEPHECVTCGRIILDGDLMQHYMEHAVQDGHSIDNLPSRSRASSPSSAWSAQDSAPSSGFSSPTSTPPASPPSKRLRSRAKR